MAGALETFARVALVVIGLGALAVFLATFGASRLVLYGVVAALVVLFALISPGGPWMSPSRKDETVIPDREREGDGDPGNPSPPGLSAYDAFDPVPRGRGADLETAVGGRTVAVSGTTDPDRPVEVSTPLTVVERGTGFVVDDDARRERRGIPEAPALREETWNRLDGLDPFGRLSVDDRLGVVSLELDGSLPGEEALLAHAEMVVAVADDVEAAVEDGLDEVSGGTGDRAGDDPASDSGGPAAGGDVEWER